MKKGFTLIEILVVVALSALFSAIALTYSGAARNEVALSVETSKIAQLILRAKDLTLATYASIPGTCGYGVYLNIPSDQYSLFAYTPAGAPPCPGAPVSLPPALRTPVTPGATWQIPLANGVAFVKPAPADEATIILFTPPAPQTYLSQDSGGASFVNTTSKIHIETVDGKASTTITINPAGQISF